MAERFSLDNSDDQEGLRSLLQEGLEDLRKRLLDLTKRNKLLNFKHGSKSGRKSGSSLRVVDELPDELFRRLTKDEARLTFKPVPEPEPLTQHPPSTENTQTLFPAQASPQDSAPNVSQRIGAKEYAAQLGISTSYDLPQPTDIQNSKHFDKYIQTLHYPEELESVLRRISGNARTALEESGSNMLYLVFGFLEWYESADSSEPLLAPLVTLPVELTRHKPSRVLGGMYEFTIEHTGEDLLTNLSLVERMKRDFALSIPLLQDNDSPETYFEKFSNILKTQPRWRIRRQITLTLLHFGKLLMFLDLDPAKNQSLLNHPRVAEFLGGQPRLEESSYGDVYDLDDPALENEVPPIVCEADSSQHSALIDALRGKNLVIEGPPGTGKSQTITNLVAAALMQGKKVLFVSEKLAALEVVRRRLDMVGLGDFCLELHSHRTKKDQLLKDLHQRMQKQRSFKECEAIRDKLQSHERHKRELIDYVNIMSKPFGALRKNVFEIFWSRERSLQAAPWAAKLASSLALSNAEEITPSEQEDQRLLVDIYQQHLAAILEKYPTVSAHPLAAIQNTSLTFFQESQVREKLSGLQRSLDALTNALHSVVTTTGISVSPTRSRIDTLCQLLPLLPQPTGKESIGLLSALSERNARDQLKDFLRELQSCGQRRADILEPFSDPPTLQQLNIGSAKHVIDNLKHTPLGNHTRSSLTAISACLSDVLGNLSEVLRFVEQAAKALNIPFNGELDTLPHFKTLCTFLQQTNFELLHLRHPALANRGFDDARASAKVEATGIKKQTSVLSQEYFLDRLPPADELWHHATTVSSSSMWSRLFSGEYRAARRCYQALRRQPENVKWSVMAVDLSELAEFQSRLIKFNENKKYREAFGTAFQGLETPFKEVDYLQAWYKNLSDAFDYTVANSEQFVHALQTQPVGALRSLAAIAQKPPTIGELLHSTPKELDRLAFAFNQNHLRNVRKTFSGTITAIQETVSELEKAIAIITSLCFQEHIKIEEMTAPLERLIEFREEERKLDTNNAIADLLGDRFKGCRTDEEELQATIDLAERIRNERIPLEFQSWLIGSNCVSRLESLKNQLSSLTTSWHRFLEDWKQFVEFVQLDERLWNGDNSGDYNELNLDVIAERLGEALNGCADLSAWLAYVRCRIPLESTPLRQLITLGDTGELKLGQYPSAYDFALYNGLTNAILKAHPALLNFSRVRHESIREKFAALDAEIIALRSKQAAFQISRNKVEDGIGTGQVGDYTDRALIDHEIRKQRGHIPIRALINRAHRALLALKPCFMMGPMSVAQYLEPGKFHFDMVVMDEASQLKPEDALGAIARASQVVVVGDPKQLPPTSFFEMLSVGDGVEEEDDALAIQESRSILDRACEVYQPIRQLRWHYRSRHESLIAFSNHQFYDQNLVLFPSPEKKSTNLGVKFNLVEDGVYSSRTNRPEADRIVSAIIAHMANCPNESLGIVTLNSSQRDLIEDLFDAQRKKDPLVEAYVLKWVAVHEPFFIKNLETVQGDERDCIFISFTFGRDSNGSFHQRFGPINGVDGHRRLNVLFTRAKLRTEVFTSMDAEDILVEATSSWGLRAMKGYLKFAQSGVLEGKQPGEQPEPNYFELAVSNALKERGLQVHPQIGVAGYFIDLAICNPTKNGSYILGIECDGATYHSAKSARDRDRLREANLRNLGWRIHRIWSTDWFKNKASEVERVEKLVASLLSTSSR